MKRVIVIGGGASGMMAAIAAAREGAQVLLFERNEKTGKKLFITGKGRCNLTNSCEREDLFDYIVNNGKFLYSAFSRMDNRGVMDFFEAAGCPLKEERGGRIFPVSDHSSDVIGTLNRQMEREGVQVHLHARVKELLTGNRPSHPSAGGAAQGQINDSTDSSGQCRITGVRLYDGRVFYGDAVILATGGRSYEATGSAGDGYILAGALGHTIKEIKPALAPFTAKETWCKELQGLSLKNTAICLKKDKKKIYEGFGEMLFTHFGVSGPLILSASSYYVKKFYGAPVQLFIDLKPALTMQQLDSRLLRDFEENKNRQFKNALGGLFPARLIPVMIRLSDISPEKKVHEITAKEREDFAGCIKHLPLTVTGVRDFSEAIITQGGIQVKEVDPSTMESRLVRGLYFSGEVLDVDALTGGFNLQIAWSTGYLAGISAAC